MPLTPLTSASARYFLRRKSATGTGTVSGPFEVAIIAKMLADGKLQGDEEISTDRQIWLPCRTLAPPVGLTASETPSQPASERPPAVNEEDDADGILLAPLELAEIGQIGGLVGDSEPPSPAHSPASSPARSQGGEPGEAGSSSDLEGFELGVPLELVEREPAPALHPPPAATVAPPAPGPAANGPSSGAPRPSSAASASVASLFDAEGENPTTGAHQPLRLDEILTAPAEVKPAAMRPRTLTAALGGQAGIPAPRGWRPTRRLIAVAASAVVVTVAVTLIVVLDLPDRVRGEPVRTQVLGDTAAAIAQDRFAAFSAGARLLEEAAEDRRHAMVTRAAAAELLASSVVIHGGERGRIAHAEALLEVRKEPGEPARSARARAFAWVALAKGRWKDAEQLASDGALMSDSDRAVLRGWAALGRENAARAVQQFQLAAPAQGPAAPAPVPSRVAALYGLARALEADLSPRSESAYRAVLTEAPTHVAAALGMARVSKLSAAGRLKLTEAVLGQQTRDASRVELGEAFALVARTARELGANDKVELALKRARDVDPANAAAAVVSGDILLGEGRTDEAVRCYKLALSAPVSAARTSWLRFARLAALIESARRTEAAVALDELDKRLPRDARVAFWRGRAAERAQPAELVAADQAYREALARDPSFLPASLQLARLLLDQHRGAEALTVLRRAEKQGAAPATLRVALGQALLASGNAVEAAKTFRQTIAADPKSPIPTAHLGLATALEAQGDLEGARAELSSLQGGGGIPGLGVRVAGVLAKLNRKQEALAAFQTEIAAGRATNQSKVSAARLALELGQKDVARALAQAAVDEDPRTPGALLVLAEVQAAQGDLAKALFDLRRALAVDGSAEVQLEYGRALAALGRDEDALSALAQAEEIPEAAVERGRILLRRGDAEGAAKLLAGATVRLPSHADAFLLLGDAEDRLGHGPRAEAAWRTAVRLAPTGSESRYRLGRLEMDRGHAALALPHLRTAAEHLPGRGQAAAQAATTPNWWPDLFFQLGFAELRQGGRERAVEAFKRYLQAAPPDASARAEVTRQLAALDSHR